jgi:hypothetical protein
MPILNHLINSNHYQFPFHNGHISSTLLLRFSSHDRSKIEDTIRMLKDDLESQQKQKDEEKRMVSYLKLIRLIKFTLH